MGCDFSVLDMNESSPGGKHTLYWDNDVLIPSNTGYIHFDLENLILSEDVKRAVCYLHMLFLTASKISTLNRLPVLMWMKDKQKGRQDQKQNEGNQPKFFTTWPITEWQIPLTLTCHQLHGVCVCGWMCVNVCKCVVSHLLLITSFLSLSLGVHVCGLQRLSDCRVPAGIPSVQKQSLFMAPAAALMGESARRWSHPFLPIRVNRLCLPTQLHLAPWFAVEKHPNLLLQSVITEKCGFNLIWLLMTKRKNSSCEPHERWEFKVAAAVWLRYNPFHQNMLLYHHPHLTHNQSHLFV